MVTGVCVADDEHSVVTDGDYTAVVFFHGMGSQRRYESASQLIDSLDAYVTSKGIGSFDREGTRVVTETNTWNSERITYIEADFENAAHKKARFYEVYWAPLAADAPSLIEVVRWLFRQAFTPFWVLLTPWRERQRLHRSVLFRMLSNEPDKITNDEVIKLCDLYEVFGETQVRTNDASTPFLDSGSFREFVEFIKDLEIEEDLKERLILLSKRWRNRYIQAQIFNLFAVYTTQLYLILVLALIALALYALPTLIPVLEHFSKALGLLENPFSGVLDSVFGSYSEEIKGFLSKNKVWLSIASVVVALGSVVAMNFFRNFLGDVLQWVTYEETNVKNQRRKNILNLGFNTLAHVLNNDKCKRLIVVGHSLGSAIAMDSLLDLRRHNFAAPENKKVKLDCFQGFITMGSPIDRIHYFFESYRVGKGKRYGSIVEEVRGDLGTEPFTKIKEPYPYWVNIHDAGDFISSGLNTPNSARNSNFLSVSNSKTATYFFPVLHQAHNGYFKTRSFLKILFEAIFHEGKPDTKIKVPQRSLRWMGFNFFLINSWIWILFIYIISIFLKQWFELPQLPIWTLFISAGFAAALLISLTFSLIIGHMDNVYRVNSIAVVNQMLKKVVQKLKPQRAKK